MSYVNYAHRGASSYAPENTLMAFYLGLELGANGIETDVQLSADGVPVLFHDSTLERVTDQTGPLAELTAEQLQAVQVFCPDFPEKKDTICTFEAFLQHFGWRDLTFAIELKGPGTAAKTLELLKKYNMKDKVFITSFVWENLAEAVALDPDWRYGYLAGDFSDGDLEKCRALGICQLCPRATNLTAEKVQAWNAAGFTVRAWGVADEALMAHAHACGTDGQTVNFPDKLTAYLKDKE